VATGSINKFDDIFSHVDTIHKRDKTDRQTPGDIKDRPYT